ncbi:hypothetical protein LTR66_013100 [Elasticomyces elasticus]|nr:hypothetical protein LTR66_013100 [Elasticomyces elasticus]
MASYSYDLLEQRKEDALHSTRLLMVEERPFQRVTKRLLAKDSLIQTLSTQLSSTETGSSSATDEQQDQDAQLQQWRTDCLLEFAALESSIVRIQLLRNSNYKERQRYATEKTKVLETAQAVRDNTAELRTQLNEAQNMLARRKRWDVLAEKITGNKVLRSREEQVVLIEKLNSEISDLEQESRDIEDGWVDRRRQFARIMDEGQRMMRLIRGEKLEEETKDEEEGIEDVDGEEEGEASKAVSRLGTPGPDAGTGINSPMPVGQDGGSTPSSQALRKKWLAVPGSPTRTPSQAASPTTSDQPAATHDADMADAEPDTAASAAFTADTEEGEEMDET